MEKKSAHKSYRGKADRPPARGTYPKPKSVFAANEALAQDADSGQTGMILGKNAVWEALCAGRTFDKLFVAEGAAQGAGRIVARARELGVPVQQCDRRKLDQMAGGQAHQGVVALCAAAEYKTLDDVLDLARARGETPLIVLCDGITDPHNLGAIIRSAEVSGAHGVVIPRRRSAGLNAACAKAAAGAVEYLPVAKCANIQSAVLELQKRGVFVFAADADAPTTLYETDLTLPCAIVIGAEGDGVSQVVRQKCDFTVRIPQKGRIGSLNASNAAAVLLYEAVRQRMNRQ